jgi:hypothetical protein
VVIRDLDIVGIAIHESKTDPPLVVNRDRMLSALMSRTSRPLK